MTLAGYMNLIWYAKRRAREYRILSTKVEAEDLVHQAYLDCLDSGTYSDAEMMRRITSAALSLRQSGVVREYDLINDKVCRKCGVLKSVQEFRNSSTKDRLVEFGAYYCKDCEAKCTKETQRRLSAELSDGYIFRLLASSKNKYTKEYVLSNPHLIEEKRAEIMKRRARQRKGIKLVPVKEQELANKYKDELTDSYVVGIICRHGKYKREWVYSHPEVIEARRNEIIEKRISKAA